MNAKCSVLLLAVVSLSSSGWAADPPATSDSGAPDASVSIPARPWDGGLILLTRGALAIHDLPVAKDGTFGDSGGFDATYRMGDTIAVLARGDDALAISAHRDAVTLYLDGTALEGLAPFLEEYPDSHEIRVYFPLRRDTDVDASRHAWDTYLESHAGYQSRPALSVGTPQDLPHAVLSRSPVELTIADLETVHWTLGVMLVLGVVSMLLLIFASPLLYEPHTNIYSLGRTQMAFWANLVFWSVLGVFWITRSVEHLPKQTLALMGIASATGLASMLIGNVDDDGKSVKKRHPTSSHAGGVAKRAWRQLIQLFRDVCDDGSGPSIHRVQVVVWTIFLGFVFVRCVVREISLPEFSTSLMLLMGISNGTYLIFKARESKTPVPTDAPPSDTAPKVAPAKPSGDAIKSGIGSTDAPATVSPEVEAPPPVPAVKTP